MRSSRYSSRNALALAFGCISLALIAPLVFLDYNDYPVLTSGAVRFLSFWVAVGLVTSIVALFSPGWLSCLLIAVLTTLSVDLLGRNVSLDVLVVTSVATYIACRILGPNRNALLFAVSGAVMIVSLVGALVPSEPRRLQVDSNRYTHDRSLPNILHIVLDEYASMDAIPSEARGAAALRENTYRTFREYGFSIYSGAYSQYYDTYNSLGNALNLAAGTVDAEHYDELGPPYKLKDSLFFSVLSSRGYGLRVYQTSFLDYCSIANVSILECTTWPAVSAGQFAYTNLPAASKSQLLQTNFWTLSQSRVVARLAYNWLADRLGLSTTWFRLAPKYTPLSSVVVLERVFNDLRRAEGGELFFVHLLHPHAWYVYDGKCTVRPLEQWRKRARDDFIDAGVFNDEASRLETYASYVEQVACANRMIFTLFDRLDDVGAFENLIVLIHGDHGARINISPANGRNVDELLASDLLDGFPTLYAVRVPGVPTTMVRNPQTLSDLLASAIGMNVGTTDKRLRLLQERGGEMVIYPMDDGWMRRVDNECTGNVVISNRTEKPLTN